jgi:signal transduction histidine kinase
VTAVRAWHRLLPRSLFGRLLLVLGAGLLVAQGLSAAINWAERDRLVDRSFGMQGAQRIADIVELLNGLDAAGRERLVAVFRTAPMVLTLADAPQLPDDADAAWPARMFGARLRAALGDERPLRVQARMPDPGPGPGGGEWRRGAREWHEAREGPGAAGRGMATPGPLASGGMNGMRMRRGAAFHGAVLRTEVRLDDGRWARFDTEQPGAPQALPLRLAATLAVLLLSMLGLSYLAVRWTVRPLQQLTQAAESLGHDLARAPLPEDGPREVQQAARAFNAMQRRLKTFVDDRTRVLTALSHDLKTPLTRMRLRAELLDDEVLRRQLEADLGEMQAMVQQTLDFMRGLAGEAPAPVDVDALLGALQSDQAALGRSLRVEGRAAAPWHGVAALLRRCLGNLVDNAMQYGGGAVVRIEDGADALVLHVLDHGPGIPGDELERVFEPFYRLEASRNRTTGGTGLGLGIARNIARGFGGDLALRNAAEGGLDAVLTLPRPAAAASIA